MPEETAVELSVESTERGGFDVRTGGSLGLSFQNSGDDALFRDICWAQWVVIT